MTVAQFFFLAFAAAVAVGALLLMVGG